jgi:hypothetical protein
MSILIVNALHSHYFILKHIHATMRLTNKGAIFKIFLQHAKSMQQILGSCFIYLIDTQVHYIVSCIWYIWCTYLWYDTNHVINLKNKILFIFYLGGSIFGYEIICVKFVLLFSKDELIIMIIEQIGGQKIIRKLKLLSLIKL